MQCACIVSNSIFFFRHLTQTDLFFIAIKLTAHLCVYVSAGAYGKWRHSGWQQIDRQTDANGRMKEARSVTAHRGTKRELRERDSQQATDVRSGVVSEGEQKPQSIRRPRAAGDGVGGG